MPGMEPGVVKPCLIKQATPVRILHQNPVFCVLELRKINASDHRFQQSMAR